MVYISEILFLALAVQPPNESVKNKLDHACEEIVTHNRKEDFIEQDLNLDRQEVSDYMIVKMNSKKGESGNVPTSDVTRRMVKAKPVKMMEWLMDHHDKLSPIGLSNMAECLRHLDNRESYHLLFDMLQDQRVIVDDNAARISAPPYWPERVCDRAYSSIGWILHKQKKLPLGLPVGLGPSNSPEQRDKAIKHLMDWWGEESSRILQNTPPLAPDRPSLQLKIEAVLRKSKHLPDTKIEQVK